MCGRIPGLCGGRGKNNSGNSQLSQSISCQSIMHRCEHSSLLPSKFWGDFFTPPPPATPRTGPESGSGRSAYSHSYRGYSTRCNVNNLIDCVPRYWSDVYIDSRIDHLPRVLPARARARTPDGHTRYDNPRARSRSLNNSALVRFKSNCCRVIYAGDGNECRAHA